MSLFITPLVAQDLEEIGDYIAQDNPIHASSFMTELLAQCQKITLNPVGYRTSPEMSNGLRPCAHGNYAIFFELTLD